MLVALFRTPLIGRSTAIFNSSLRGTARSAKLSFIARSPTSVVSLRTTLAGTRSFTTTFASRAAAAAAKRVSAKKSTTKKKTAAKGKPAKRKKGAAAKKKVVAKRSSVKARPKRKKVVKKKSLAPKMVRRDTKPPFKKPSSAWTNFVAEYYKKQRAAGGSTQLKDHLLVASAEWKQMGDEQKAPYDVTPSEREEYRVKLREWRASLSRSQKMAIRKYRKVHNKARAKQPRSALVQFVKENFVSTQFPSEVADARDKMRHLAKLYGALSDTEKEDLKERARKEFEESKAASL